MRLSPREKKTITNLATRFFGDKTRVVLFGSRVNDSLRGGDIDLLILPGKPLEEPYWKKLTFRAELKNWISVFVNSK